MNTSYFMDHVRNHEYVKACGDTIGPLIQVALQVLHRVELPSAGDRRNRKRKAQKSTSNVEKTLSKAEYQKAQR